MKVLVCGGRAYRDAAHLNRVLDWIHAETPITQLIEGGARGADSLARQWAESRQILVRTFTANWGKYKNAAGPIRNAQMIVEGKPDLVVAFPGGNGTADMKRKAIDAGIDTMDAPLALNDLGNC